MTPAMLSEKHLLEIAIHAKRIERRSEEAKLNRLKDRLQALTQRKVSGSSAMLPSARCA